jgi:anti-sigma regulatory factor (Ser/Thr protein kinase)
VISKIETLLIQKANLASNVMQGFKYLVAEIIDNVFEHSGTNKAWIFAQYYPTKEYFDLCILDVGKGILGSYKEKGYEEVETDKDAVINAISGNSTKEYYNERGKGLTTTIKLTRNGFSGDYILISGDAMFFNEKIIQMPISWQGTIVCYRLNKNKPNLNLYNYVE